MIRLPGFAILRTHRPSWGNEVLWARSARRRCGSTSVLSWNYCGPTHHCPLPNPLRHRPNQKTSAPWTLEAPVQF